MIGARIKEARKRIKMTQPELAEKIGVHETTVRRWERDRDNGPSAEILKRIAEALNTTADYLLKGEPFEPEPQAQDTGQNLPIDNAPEAVNNQSENLGLGYWGSVADNARKIAAKGNAQEKAAVLMMLKMATEAITGECSINETGAKISQRADNIHGNVNQSVGK